MKLFSRVRIGFWYSLATAAIWAVYIVATKYLLSQGEHPLNLVVWFGLASCTAWLFVFRRHTREFLAVPMKYKLLLIGIGVATGIGVEYLESLALAHTTAVNFAFLYRMIVVFTVILAYFFFGEPITKKKALLVILILAGSYLLTTGGKGLTLTKGDIYTLLMAAAGAFLGNILIKHTVSKMHPDISGSTIAFVSTGALLTLALIHGVFGIPHNLPLIALVGTLGFALIATRNRAYKHATASMVTMVISATPLFVALLSFPLLGERLGAVEALGGIIIVGSAILVEKFQI